MRVKVIGKLPHVLCLFPDLYESLLVSLSLSLSLHKVSLSPSPFPQWTIYEQQGAVPWWLHVPYQAYQGRARFRTVQHRYTVVASGQNHIEI